MREDILTAQEVKAHAESGREANCRTAHHRANPDRQAMNVDGDQPTVTDRDERLFSLAVIKSKPCGFIDGEDRHEGAGVHVGFRPNQSVGSLQANADNRAGKASVGEVWKADHRKSAHTKSWGRGMGRPVGIIAGCLRRASANKALASRPTNNSPPATTAYWPAYLSTNSSKCQRIHSSSVLTNLGWRFVIRRVGMSTLTLPRAPRRCQAEHCGDRIREWGKWGTQTKPLKNGHLFVSPIFLVLVAFSPVAYAASEGAAPVGHWMLNEQGGELERFDEGNIVEFGDQFPVGGVQG